MIDFIDTLYGNNDAPDTGADTLVAKNLHPESQKDDGQWIAENALETVELIHAVHGLHGVAANPLELMRFLNLLDQRYFSYQKKSSPEAAYAEEIINIFFS